MKRVHDFIKLLAKKSSARGVWKHLNFRQLTHLVKPSKRETTMEITKEKVLKAAKACPDSEPALRALFPDAFSSGRKGGSIDLSQMKEARGRYGLFSRDESLRCGFNDQFFLQIRANGSHKHKAFKLSQEYDWTMKVDDKGALILIPTRK